MRSLAFVALIAAALPLSAVAAPVTVSISGTWDVVDDPGGVLSGAVVPGTSFAALLSYDDTAPIIYSDPTTANYDLGALPFSLDVATGGFTFTWFAGGTTQLDLVNGSFDNASGFFENLSGTPGLPPIGYSYMLLALDDASATALSSTALAALPWSLAPWGSADFGVFFGVPGTYVDLQGSISALAVVPEPGTPALLAAGFVLLAARARRRS
ncbi:hypothetical protein MYXO_01115 [Myxococcaceae bacterium]|jgi:hypothetical protein|nr:hypothetical protein MYXO_01115 [Myxococcaceae bacterium]